MPSVSTKVDSRKMCLIYKSKCTMCDAIDIGNTQQTFKKQMDSHFINVQHILKSRQKSDSLSFQCKCCTPELIISIARNDFNDNIMS